MRLQRGARHCRCSIAIGREPNVLPHAGHCSSATNSLAIVLWPCARARKKVKNEDEDEEGETEKKTEREKETERERERQRERQREKRKHRHGPQTLMLLREPLLRSQSVACADVQAGAFKALAGLATTKKLALRSDSLVGVSRRVERDPKKTGARELVITGGAQSGRLWRARTPSICE